MAPQQKHWFASSPAAFKLRNSAIDHFYGFAIVRSVVIVFGNFQGPQCSFSAPSKIVEARPIAGRQSFPSFRCGSVPRCRISCIKFGDIHQPTNFPEPL